MPIVRDKNQIKWLPISEDTAARELFKMANLTPDETGLDRVVWVSEKGNAKHAARIKVSPIAGNRIQSDGLVTVTLDNDPRVIGDVRAIGDLQKIKKFIRRNRKILLSYWNQTISTKQLLDGLKRVDAPLGPDEME